MRRLFFSAVAAASLLFLVAASIEDASAKGRSGSRPSYSGNKHSSSHGGKYSGGSGSSHKGGDYKNSRSGDRYGKHKE
jgi:uncharacterized membrane protein YgcG